MAALLQLPRVREIEPYGSLRQQTNEFPGEPLLGVGFEDIAETVQTACEDARRSLLAGSSQKQRKQQREQQEEDVIDVDAAEAAEAAEAARCDCAADLLDVDFFEPDYDTENVY